MKRTSRSYALRSKSAHWCRRMMLLAILTTAGASHAAASLPHKPVPVGMLELPAGGAGRILTSRSNGVNSARKLLTSFRGGIADYFTQFTLTSTVADSADRNLQAIFTAKLDNVPVRGVITIRTQGTQGQATMLFDRASNFGQANGPLKVEVGA